MIRLRLKSTGVAIVLLFLTGASLGLPLSVQVSAVAQTSQDATAARKKEARRLFNQGDYQTWDHNIPAAIHFYQQALKIYQEIKDTWEQVSVLGSLSGAYLSQRDFGSAIKYAQQSLILAREVRNDYGEATALMRLSDVYEYQANYAEAVKYTQQAWRVAQQIENPNNRYLAQSSALIGLIQLYSQLGNESKANEYRAISKKLAEQDRSTWMQNNRDGEIGKLIIAASNCEERGEYIKAIGYYEQLLTIGRKTSNPYRELASLGSIGRIYFEKLNNPSQAIKYYEQQSAAGQKIPGAFHRSAGLLELGYAYETLRNLDKAFEYFNRYLTVARENSDRAHENIALNVLAEKYSQIGNHEKAIAYYQQLISFEYEGKNDSGVIYSSFALGRVYQAAHRYSESIEAYQRALSIAQEKGDRKYEASALEKIGELYRQQNQPELAIVFYKQSVNIYESIREDIRKLPRETQETYAQSVAGTYRSLADLLIQQGRLPEAQAVLELLKLRELRDFTRDAGIDSSGINLANVEATALKQILQRYTTVGEFSQKIDKCELTHCPELKQLQDQRDRLNQAVTTELTQQRAILAKYFSTESATLTPDKLTPEARDIVNAQPGTILIYPLILKDKIQFLLALKAGDGAVVLRPIEAANVSAETLFKTIQIFRGQLQSPTNLAALQATSQQLYTWLIKPLEPELNNPTIKHLVFAPDSTTRYIPLAALFDGKRYLIERYSISTITAASETDTSETFAQLPVNASFLLATGASTFANANPLENVPAELAAIVKLPDSPNTQGIYPGVKLLNTQFDFDALKANLKGHRVLHIATHGKFQPGRPEDSYLLPGRGQNLTTTLIDQLGQYGLKGIHLVVLSACETAVGDRASDGIEIPGISYFFLKNKVKAVMASLWSVNDASTSLLMQQFYKQLAIIKMTKAEALQSVQRQFITGKLTAKDAPSRSPTLVPKGSSQGHSSSNGDFSHPFYWAPFILIGNSL